MGRDLIIQRVTARMMEAFVNGDIIDAQNLGCFLSSLENMTDDDYETLVEEEQPGAIA